MTKKIKYILLFSVLIILGLCTQSQARITTSDPTVQSGGTATITISSQEAVAFGSIDVTNNGGLTFVSVSGGTANGTMVAFAGTENKKSGIATYKFKVPEVSKDTTYKVTFSSADMGTAEGSEVAASTAKSTVTVKAKSSGGSGSSSGSSGSSSGSGSKSNSSQSAPTFTEKDETVYATDSVNVRSSYSTSSSVIGSLSAGDSVKRTGLATKAVNGITWSRVSYNGRTGYVSSSYLTTEKPEESNNKDLKSLSVGNDLELTPAFSVDVTEYTLTVGDDITSLDIEAVADDENAEVEITGNDNLLMGENTVEIKVTAEDGTVRTYTINVTKGDAAAIAETTIALEALSIDGYTLSPEFSKNIYEYTLDVPDTSVTSLNVNAISDTEDAAIEIIGNNNLTVGENVITILVKSADGSEVTTYQVIANIHEPEKAQLIAGIDDEDLFLYGGVGLAALVVIIIIIVVAIVKGRKNADDDYETYYGGFTSLKNDDDNKEKNKKAKKDKADKEDNDKDNKESDEVVENVPVGVVAENKESDKKISIADEKDEKRKSVIEENFGADVNIDNLNDDEPKRKRGKHF